MCVNDGVDVGTSFVYHTMHRPFGRDLVFAGFQQITLEINHTHHLRPHPSFAYGGWSSDDAIWRNANADVAVACHQQTAVITSRGNFYDLRPDFPLVSHYSLCESLLTFLTSQRLVSYINYVAPFRPVSCRKN